jgi:DNA-binding NarL/FixJ family response regulator
MSPHKPLTEREWQVARLIAKGLDSNQIAAELGLSTKTFDTHRMAIAAKLNIPVGSGRNVLIARHVFTTDGLVLP